MLMFACRAEEAGSCVGRRSRRFIQSKSSWSSRRRAKGLCPHASASGPPCCDLQLGRLITGSFDLRFMPALLFPSPRQQKACLNNLLLMKTLQERDGEPFAASSCSGHIDFESFLEIVQEALSKSRKRGKVLLIKGQPEDHPFPLALPEMRYLKFVYLQIFWD
jgi:hypothetical protein